MAMTLNQVREFVIKKTTIGGEFAITRSTTAGKRTHCYTVDAYYPRFVLALDEAGARECFAYIDVWNALNGNEESEVSEEE